MGQGQAASDVAQKLPGGSPVDNPALEPTRNGNFKVADLVLKLDPVLWMIWVLCGS